MIWWKPFSGDTNFVYNCLTDSKTHPFHIISIISHSSTIHNNNSNVRLVLWVVVVGIIINYFNWNRKRKLRFISWYPLCLVLLLLKIMANYYSQQWFIHITEKNFLRQMEVHNKYIFFLSRSRSHYITLRKSTNIFSHYTHHRRHIWCYGTVPQLFLFTFHLSPFSIGRYIIHKVAIYFFFPRHSLTF